MVLVQSLALEFLHATGVANYKKESKKGQKQKIESSTQWMVWKYLWNLKWCQFMYNLNLRRRRVNGVKKKFGERTTKQSPKINEVNKMQKNNLSSQEGSIKNKTCLGST